MRTLISWVGMLTLQVFVIIERNSFTSVLGDSYIHVSEAIISFIFGEIKIVVETVYGVDQNIHRNHTFVCADYIVDGEEVQDIEDVLTFKHQKLFDARFGELDGERRREMIGSLVTRLAV